MAAFKKILKNTTNSAILLSELGIEIFANSSYELEIDEYIMASRADALAEIDTYLSSGSIVVNDGIKDLSYADGKKWLEINFDGLSTRIATSESSVLSSLFPGVTTETLRVVLENLANNQIVTALPSFRVQWESENGDNKWAGLSEESHSDQSPWVAPFNGRLDALDYSNKYSTSDVDIEIYKNGSLVYTWVLRDKLTAYKVSKNLLAISQGDVIKVKFKKPSVSGYKKPKDVIFAFYFQATSFDEGDG